MTEWPKALYGVIALTGGDRGALDRVDGTNLKDKDGAIYIPSIGKARFFSLDVDSGLDEDPPNIIKPDTNAGDKRWIFKEFADGLPDGTNTGDIIRWNAASETWEPVASPYKEMVYEEAYKAYLVEE